MGWPVTTAGEITEATWDAQYGAGAWPFTVPAARLKALGPGVFVEVGGIHHPLNGAAEALLHRVPGGGRELERIRRRGPDGLYLSTMGVIACAVAHALPDP